MKKKVLQPFFRENIEKSKSVFKTLVESHISEYSLDVPMNIF